MNASKCNAPHLDVEISNLQCPKCGSKVYSAFSVKNLKKGGNSLVCTRLHPDDRVYCSDPKCSYDAPATDVSKD